MATWGGFTLIRASPYPKFVRPRGLPRRPASAPERCSRVVDDKWPERSGKKVDIGIFGNPMLLISMVAGFSADAFDVSSPHSLHILSNIDVGVHQWVSTHMANGTSQFVFDRVVSDFFIVIPIVLWTLLDCTQETPNIGSTQAANLGEVNVYGESGISRRVYVGVGAAMAFSMMLFKEVLFPRYRPNAGLATLSFPSGHTMTAVMFTGMLLIRMKFEMDKARTDTGEGVPRWVAWTHKYGESLVIVSALVTAAGRIGADVHWVSDTIAGACMGLGAISAIAISYNAKASEKLDASS